MMKHFFLLLLAAAIGGVQAAPEVTCTMLSGQKVVELKNTYLQLTAVPGTMGAVVRLKWLPGNSELFNSYKYTCISINELLPEQKSVTVWGNRTLIWNGTVLFYQPLAKFTAKSGKQAVILQMSGKYIGGLPVEMTRTLTLEEETSLLKISVTVTNFGPKALPIRLWEHLVPNPERSIPHVSMISGSGVRRLGRYQDTERHKGGLLIDTFKDGNLNRYIVPGSNWIAATGGKTPLTVFLRTDEKNLEKDGFFYTQKDAVAKLHTVELLLKEVSLSPGQSRRFEFEMGVLSKLQTLRRLTDSHGFDFQRSGKDLTWQAGVFRKTPARKFLLKNGQWQKEFTVPALFPGKCASGRISGVPETEDDLFIIEELSK